MTRTVFACIAFVFCISGAAFSLVNSRTPSVFSRHVPHEERVWSVDVHSSEGSDGIRFLRSAAVQSRYPDVKAAALDRIMHDSHTAELWDLLEDLATREDAPETRRKMSQKLILNVRKARPEHARAYLRKMLFVDDPVLRLNAVRSWAEFALVEDEDPWPALRQLVAVYPQDRGIIHDLMVVTPPHGTAVVD